MADDQKARCPHHNSPELLNVLQGLEDVRMRYVVLLSIQVLPQIRVRFAIPHSLVLPTP